MRGLATVLVVCFLFCGGCAEVPTDPDALAYYNEINDPMEPINRKIFAFNQALDKAVLRPVAKGYNAAVPEFARTGIRSMFFNLGEPVNFANSVLQLNMECAVRSIIRFVFNTAFGLFGFYDTAAEIGLAPCKNDLGTTLAKYGVPKGPMLMLPVLGQTYLRDAFGAAGDHFMSPLVIYGIDKNPHDDLWKVQEYALPAMDGITTRAQFLNITDSVEKDSVDLYASYREMLYRIRQKEINERLGVSEEEKQQSYDFDIEIEDDDS